MLKFGNKEFRNLQEQVYENMKDIAKMKEGVYVLDEFGIKVVGEVESLADLPTVQEYKEEHEDWAYGDAYAVGTEAPYALYILTRANSKNPDDYWFDIGEFPMPGPQGETGAQGPVGPQGPQGNTGAAGTPAGFGTITATAETLVPGSSATATVVASGPDSEKSFAFTFGIPRGQDGEDLDVNWGEIQGTLSDQTDLQDALDAKQDAILNYDSSTANSVTFKDNIILKNESNQTTTIGRASGLAISTDQVTILNASNDAIIPNLNIRPLRDNAISIGNDISRIKDIKMAGVIGDGTHTFTLPSNTGTLLTNNDLNGYATQTWVNQQGFITGITSSDVISALGYTPYNSSNPNGYISGITSSMVTTALGYTPGTSNFSGSYNDLSDKPTIPSVSGTNDGTNWTTITINNDTYGIGGGSAPSNYVTTDTAQTITGSKTFSNDIILAEGAKIINNVEGVNRNYKYVTLEAYYDSILDRSYGVTIYEHSANVALVPFGTPTLTSYIGSINRHWDKGYIDELHSSSIVNGSSTLSLPSTTGTLALTSDILGTSTETWTFEVDDGQGGTTTVTKTIVLG